MDWEKWSQGGRDKTRSPKLIRKCRLDCVRSCQWGFQGLEMLEPKSNRWVRWWNLLFHWKIQKKSIRNLNYEMKFLCNYLPVKVEFLLEENSSKGDERENGNIVGKTYDTQEPKWQWKRCNITYFDNFSRFWCGLIKNSFSSFIHPTW